MTNRPKTPPRQATPATPPEEGNRRRLPFLEKLLDGAEVAWLELGDGRFFFVANRGRKPVKSSLRVAGETPYYGANNIQDYVDGHTHDGEYVLIAEDGSASLKHYSIQYANGKFWANNHVHVVAGKEVVNTRYLYHYLCIVNFIPFLTGGGRAKLTKAKMVEVAIPIPCPDDPEKSLAIQAEIVRILDAFTKLTAKLTAERNLRQKQYHYYRDKLLDFTTPQGFAYHRDHPALTGTPPQEGNDPARFAATPPEEGNDPMTNRLKTPPRQATPATPPEEGNSRRLPFLEKLLDGAQVAWLPLGDLATVTIGEFVRKDRQDSSAPYPVYNGGTSNTGFYNQYNNIGNKIIVSARGANAGFVNKITKPYWAGNSCYSIGIKNENKINWAYIYYYLKTNENKLIGGQQKGGIPAVSKKQMETFQIPIPCPDDPEKSLAIQAEIVRILDKFDALTNSILEGLPREIELRQKQYEYYRNQLLNFPKPENQKFPSSGGVAGEA